METKINAEFTYDPNSKEWYLNDKEVNNITDILDDLQLNVERKIRELQVLLDQAEEAVDNAEALVDCLDIAEPDSDLESEWKAWNIKSNEAWEERNEVTQKRNSIESVLNYLTSVNDAINKVF